MAFGGPEIDVVRWGRSVWTRHVIRVRPMRSPEVGAETKPLLVPARTVIQVVLFTAFCAVFAVYAFNERYSPDFFVQRQYLHEGETLSPDPISSLANNTLVLDYLVPLVSTITLVDLERALKLMYVSVFVLKYLALLRYFPLSRYAVVVFLWTFSSLDVNQMRLNLALVFAILLLGQQRRRVAYTTAMLAAHVASAAFLSVIITQWARQMSRWRVAAALALAAIGIAYVAPGLDLSASERFLSYIEPEDSWLPKALVAAPVMLICLRWEADRLSRAVLAVAVAVPLLLAAINLSVLAARLMEMVYAAYVIRVGVSDQDPSHARASLLFVPAVLMFTFRAVLGVNPGG